MKANILGMVARMQLLAQDGNDETGISSMARYLLSSFDCMDLDVVQLQKDAELLAVSGRISEQGEIAK